MKGEKMEPFRCEFPGRAFTLYPLGDWHVGSRQCDEAFIRQVVDEIRRRPDARWVGMGDFMENAIVGSKSDVYTQVVPPKTQMDYIVDILEPIREKGLFIIAGNHEQRTMRMAGIQPEAYIATRLDLPFTGFSCYARFALKDSHNSANRYFTAYFHHNYGGGYSMGGKINRAEQLRLIVPTADAIFSGHFHTTSRTPITWYELGETKIIEKRGVDYITGSALDWPESYAEERARRPAVKEHITVEFVAGKTGSYDSRQQNYGIIAKKQTPPKK